jgi:hypothetical protein
MTNKMINLVFNEIMRIIYASSTPVADWDSLLESASTNELGQKIIDFDSYVCPEKTQDKIMEDVFRELKVPKFYRSKFRATITLGASPRYKPKIINEI